MTGSLVDELDQRGLLAQVSDREGLTQHLAASSRVVYAGFDPTADSLHIGNLVPLFALRRYQLRGHRPILLLGGATGLIGDPSGRDDERSLNSPEVVAGWVDRIRAQAEGFLEFGGDFGATVVNNLDWTANLDVISFLRDVGKHFSVNQMIQRESVRSRLDRAEAGISYTEFSYMLLQAMDYAELAERYECTVQVGGSDQWGNIVSGMDLVRRRLGREAFAMTVPLIAKSDGTKFGKTAGGAVWLDPARTSPYAFYQFWLNTADADVLAYLRVFTFLADEEIAALAGELVDAPQHRTAQRRLAQGVTELVHGAAAVRSAEAISDALFGGDVAALSEADLQQLQQDGMAATVLDAAPIGLLDAMVRAELAGSRGAARKLVQGGGVRINGVAQQGVDRELDWQDALFGRFYLLRRGKKHWHLLVREQP